MKYVVRVFLMTTMALTALGSLSVGTHAMWQPAGEHDNAREALRRGDILPYSRIKKIVERQVDGKVVGQKLRRTNRGWQYDLRVRPENGRVMVLIVDARNGAIVSRR